MSSLEMSQYAQVLFVNVPKNYPVGADIEVKYTVTSQLQPTKADWLGIFKIGWCSASPDALHRVWIQIPEKYEPGQPSNGVALFEGASLPKDTEEFYQFCYINSKGQVRGASTPFQFRRSDAGEEDFVEEDIEDMLVVTSKSAILDEKLELATEKIKVLAEEKLELVKDRQNLMLELSHVKKKQEHLAANLEAQQLLAEEVGRNLASANAEREKLTGLSEVLAKQNAELTKRELEMKSQLAQLRAAWEAARDEALQHAASLRDKSESSLAAEARYSVQLHETQEQLNRLQGAYDQLLAQFHKVNDDLQGERRRFAALEQTLTSSQAEIKEQLKQNEQRMRCELDAALLASRGCLDEAAELRARLERLQGEDERLRQALAASEEKIRELIGLNAELVEDTGHEQEEANKVSSALNAELAAVKAELEAVKAELAAVKAELEAAKAELAAAKAELAETESQLQQSQLPQGGGDGCREDGGASGYSLDSYHALLTAYEELKLMLRERTRERDALVRNEKSVRAGNSKLTLEKQSLAALLAATEEECCGLRRENQSLKEAADKRHAVYTGSCLDDSWVCTPPQTSTATIGASTTSNDGASGSSTAMAAMTEKEQHATIVKQLREQLLASDEYYMSTLQLTQKDLQHERESRQELQRLLQKATSRCSCSEISDALSRQRDQSLGGASTSAAADTERSAIVAPWVQTAPSAAPGLTSSCRDRLRSSDDDSHRILEPPDDPFLLTAPCYSSRVPATAAVTRPLGPLLSDRPTYSDSPTDRDIVDSPQPGLHQLQASTFRWVQPNADLRPPPSGLPVPDTRSGLPQPFPSLMPTWSHQLQQQQRGVREPSSFMPTSVIMGSPATECCVCRKRFEPQMTIGQREEHVNSHFSY